MKILYRIVERRLGDFFIGKRGALWGWNVVKDTDRPYKPLRWINSDEAERWIKGQIPYDVFRPRVVSEWFVSGEKKPNGK